MKYLVIILLFISNLSFTQTKLDSLVFDRINKYRDSIGLNKVEWNSIAFKTANNHSIYLSNNSTNNNFICGHNQKTSGYETPTNRWRKFKGEDKTYFAEISNFTTTDKKEDNDEFYSLIANKIIKLFINSEEHKKAMINDKVKFIGVSTTYKVKDNGVKKGTKYYFEKYLIHTCIILTN
jgi:uncharacterized protein YkwD